VRIGNGSQRISGTILNGNKDRRPASRARWILSDATTIGEDDDVTHSHRCPLNDKRKRLLIQTRGQTLAEAIQDKLRPLDRDAVVLIAFIAGDLGGTHAQALGQVLLRQTIGNSRSNEETADSAEEWMVSKSRRRTRSYHATSSTSCAWNERRPHRPFHLIRTKVNRL
jgi:hypothetical protein